MRDLINLKGIMQFGIIIALYISMKISFALGDFYSLVAIINISMIYHLIKTLHLPCVENAVKTIVFHADSLLKKIP